MAPIRARLPCVLLIWCCWSAGASAQDAAAQPPEVADAPPLESADAQVDVEAEESAMQAENAAAAARRQHVDAQRKVVLTRELQAVQREEQDTSRLLPLLVTGTGIALLVTGIAAAAGNAIACDDSCRMPFWPAWLVVAGATGTTAGGVWWALKDRDLAELRSRRFQIERELNYLEWSAGLTLPQSPQPGARVALTLHYAF